MTADSHLRLPRLAGRAGPVAWPLARHKQSTGLFVSGLGVLLDPPVQRGLLGPVALVVDRRAIRRLMARTGLPTDSLHGLLTVRVAKEPRFADVRPAGSGPTLADKGVYLASESTFSRVLRAHGQTTRRGRAKTPRKSHPPTTHIATGPRQVWCWDMTYRPAEVVGRWLHRTLILNLYSRKIVGWEVHHTASAEHAVLLVRRTTLAEGMAELTGMPVLHGDNGSTIKALTVLATLQRLGTWPSYSRP